MGYSLKSTLDCNGECRSCYEHSIRSDRKTPYQIDKIHATLDRIIEEQKKIQDKGGRICDNPTLHGGEPLLMKTRDIEGLLKKIHGFWGHTGIQTNGLLITPEILKLFLKYKTNIGISLDGDTAELNWGRWNLESRSREFVQKRTQLVLDNMKAAHELGIRISIIVILRKYNASQENLPELLRFLDRMWHKFDVVHVRLNPAVVYNEAFREEEELTGEEYGQALSKVFDMAVTNPELKYRPLLDMIDLLMGNYDQTCLFNQCDPFHTRAEMAINHEGVVTNCLHPGIAAVEKIQIPQAEKYNTQRYDLLLNLPQEHGGCKACIFWHVCNGGCPGAGIDNDWRNRSRFCEGYKIIFSKLSNVLKSMMPTLYLSPEFFPAKAPAAAVQAALRSSCHRMSSRPEFKKVLDKVISQDRNCNPHADQHANRHGDRPHGDHTDRSKGK